MKRLIFIICICMILSCVIACGDSTKKYDATEYNTTEHSDKNTQSTKDMENKSDMNMQEDSEQTLSSEENAIEEDNKEEKDNADKDTTFTRTETISSDWYSERQSIEFNTAWQYGANAVITSGSAVLYRSSNNRKDIVIAVNAGHGTVGGTTVKTLCHPDGSAKTTGGTTAQGATMAVAVSSGMTFNDGVAESKVALRMAEILRDALLEEGYDVLMLRDSDDVQLDNVARTVMANNIADCHIALHWDGDGLSYDKGCFYIAVPNALKDMEPVASHWEKHNALGEALISGLSNNGAKINGHGSMQIDLTQTSYSTIPSVDIELGNSCSDHSDSALETLKDGLVQGINEYFG